MDDTATAVGETELLVAYLRDRDVDCPSCGYNVRNLTSPRCPECGEALVMQLRLAEPKQKMMITGLVGLSAGLGFSLLLLLYWFATVIARGRTGGPESATIIATLGGGGVVFAGLIFAWLSFWSRIRGSSLIVRLLLAIGCWVLAIANVFVFAALID
jgi:DNA-directed RNA polymerase subunit RPC12/RpoP